MDPKPSPVNPRPFPSLEHPIIQAPMAGGPSTPALAAAVCEAGGLGFLAAGYKSAEAVEQELAALGALTRRPFGLNLFVPGPRVEDPSAVRAYLETLVPEAARLGVGLGEPRWDDDGWEEKLALAERVAPAVVSFVFGCPSREVIERLQRRGSAVWVTVTEPSEAREAAQAGADALVVQGVEAGGHRGSFRDVDGVGERGLLALLSLVRREVALPLVGAGGIAGGEAVAAVLAAGARAAQVGTAFLLCPEAGTSAPHREALAREGVTGLTRAFTGRRARGIANAFQRAHSAQAPSAYPQVGNATAPLRAAARKAGDAERLHLWAGEAYPLAEGRPAGELVRAWGAQAREALKQALLRCN